MRYKLAAAGGYVALTTFWLYGIVDQALDVPEAPTWIVLVAAQLALGVLVGRWGLLLPPAMVLVSLPVGFSDAYPTEIPIWFGTLILAVPACVLVAVGALARLVFDRERPSRAARGSRNAPGTDPPVASRR